MTNAKTSLDRRTVLKGAAWSAPVIATTLATPLAATSGDLECPTLQADTFPAGGTQEILDQIQGQFNAMKPLLEQLGILSSDVDAYSDAVIGAATTKDGSWIAIATKHPAFPDYNLPENPGNLRFVGGFKVAQGVAPAGFADDFTIRPISCTLDMGNAEISGSVNPSPIAATFGAGAGLVRELNFGYALPTTGHSQPGGANYSPVPQRVTLSYEATFNNGELTCHYSHTWNLTTGETAGVVTDQLGTLAGVMLYGGGSSAV